VTGRADTLAGNAAGDFGVITDFDISTGLPGLSARSVASVASVASATSVAGQNRCRDRAGAWQRGGEPAGHARCDGSRRRHRRRRALAGGYPDPVTPARLRRGHSDVIANGGIGVLLEGSDSMRRKIEALGRRETATIAAD